jgi:thiol-disulfide isomerase/thioredoxin
MKKAIYTLCLLALCFACNKTRVDYHQIALDSEALLDSIDEQYTKGEEAGTLTPELEAKLDGEWNTQFEKVKADYARFFENTINDSIGQEIFATSRWARRLSPEQLDAVLAKAGNEFKATDLYKTYSERLHNMKTSVPGNPFKEIVSEDTIGNEIKLSDYVGKGKYVLLDFWASWCPDCRKEMPDLVELYAEYKGDNFEIVGYSLDKDDQAWKNGIEQLHITWPQMSDCDYWESAPVKSYAVQGIPCTLLIDPEGKIIARGLTGKELADEIREKIQKK